MKKLPMGMTSLLGHNYAMDCELCGLYTERAYDALRYPNVGGA